MPTTIKSCPCGNQLDERDDWTRSDGLCCVCVEEIEYEAQRAEDYSGPDFADDEQFYPEWTQESGRCWTGDDEIQYAYEGGND